MKSIIKWALFWFWFFIAIFLCSIVIKASWTSTQTGIIDSNLYIDNNWWQLTKDKWNALVNLVKWSSNIPSNTIWIFYQTNCPAWRKKADWTNWTPDLRWMFLRWMDEGIWNDPDWASRTLGSIQQDSFQWHTHNINQNAADKNSRNNSPVWWDLSGYDKRGRNSAIISVTEPTTYSTYWTPRIANETRPKNIAVLYCIKE